MAIYLFYEEHFVCLNVIDIPHGIQLPPLIRIATYIFTHSYFFTMYCTRGPTQILTVKVVSLKDFGAFVELPNGMQALLHVSELSHGKIRALEDHVREGESFEVMCIGKDNKGLLKLSRKSLLPAPLSALAPRGLGLRAEGEGEGAAGGAPKAGFGLGGPEPEGAKAAAADTRAAKSSSPSPYPPSSPQQQQQQRGNRSPPSPRPLSAAQQPPASPAPPRPPRSRPRSPPAPVGEGSVGVAEGEGRGDRGARKAPLGPGRGGRPRPTDRGGRAHAQGGERSNSSQGTADIARGDDDRGDGSRNAMASASNGSGKTQSSGPTASPKESKE